MPTPHFDLAPKLRMHSYIQRVATGPELGKSISEQEAQDGMECVLSGDIDVVQCAVYLIGLRMKRETEDENAGSLKGLLRSVKSCEVNIDDLVDIADPFDGFVRGVPASSFLPSVLSACGVPAVIQGAESIGPKFGVTPSKILRAAGINVNYSPSQAARKIEQTDIGWAYLDQSQSCPALHELVSLRGRMVKRSILTTIETLTRPLQARKTHMMGGYVHRAYTDVYTKLARVAGYDSAMVVRGVEGGVIPTLTQVARYFRFIKAEKDEKVRLDPSDLGIVQKDRCMAIPNNLPKPVQRPDELASAVDTKALASVAAQLGLKALNGESGPIFDSLVYGAAICLHHLGKVDSLAAGADTARDIIHSGKALKHFNAARD